MLKWLVKHRMHKKVEELFSDVEGVIRPVIEVMSYQAVNACSEELRDVLLEEKEKDQGEKAG